MHFPYFHARRGSTTRSRPGNSTCRSLKIAPRLATSPVRVLYHHSPVGLLRSHGFPHRPQAAEETAALPPTPTIPQGQNERLCENVRARHWQTTAHGPDPAHHLFIQIKFYWHMALLIHLYIVRDALAGSTSRGPQSLKCLPPGALRREQCAYLCAGGNQNVSRVTLHGILVFFLFCFVLQ